MCVHTRMRVCAHATAHVCVCLYLCVFRSCVLSVPHTKVGCLGFIVILVIPWIRAG